MTDFQEGDIVIRKGYDTWDEGSDRWSGVWIVMKVDGQQVRICDIFNSRVTWIHSSHWLMVWPVGG